MADLNTLMFVLTFMLSFIEIFVIQILILQTRYHLAQQCLTPAARGLVATPCIHAKLTAVQCLLFLLVIKFPVQMYRTVHVNRDGTSRLLNKMHEF